MSAVQPTYTVRRATDADLETLIRLRRAMQTEIVAPSVEALAAFEEATRRYLSEVLPTGDFLAWVAEADNGEGIIGTSGLVFFRRPPTMRLLSGIDAYVMNMYTVPSWRGRGIAAALLNELLTYVRTTDAGRVFLHAQPAARPVYERAGFIGNNDEMVLRL